MNTATLAGAKIIEGLTVYSDERKCIVFAGTNVPVVYLWDAVMNDETVASFIARFPSVSRERVLDLIKIAADSTDGF